MIDRTWVAPSGAWQAVAACLLLALALRAGAMIGLGYANRGVDTAHDEHATIARSLARGEGFRFNFFGRLDAPVLTSQQAPLVPGVLAAAYLLFGIETQSAFAAMLWMQILLSSATVAGLAWLGTALARSPLVGWTTGLLAACYPPLIVSALHVQALAWNLFWLTNLLIATQLLRTDRLRLGPPWFVLAAVGSLLTDPILALVITGLVVAVAWEWRRRGIVHRTLRMTAIVLGIAVGVTPWIWRNYEVHGRFVFIKDSFFYVLWQGNNLVSWGTDKLPVADADAMNLRDVWSISSAVQSTFAVRSRAVSVNVVLTQDEIKRLQSMPTEMERMGWFAQQAIREIGADPLRYLRLCAHRLGYWIWFDATNPRSYLWHYRIGYLAVLAFGAIGFSCLARPAAQWLPIYISAGALTSVHVLVITSARFRIPFELLLLLGAGLTLARAWRATMQSRLPLGNAVGCFATTVKRLANRAPCGCRQPGSECRPARGLRSSI